MKTEDWDRLLAKYFDGKTTLEEEQKIRDHFAEQDDPDSDNVDSDILSAFNELRESAAPLALWDRVDATIDSHKPIRKHAKINGFNILWKIAAVLVLTLSGFATGIWYANHSSADTVNDIAKVLESHFEQASASGRIKFIRTKYDNSGEQRAIKQILIQALNNDDNVNVRIAAAEALYHFRSDAGVREALIRSLPNQTNPNVQITLIDMLIEMHEKKAVPEMQVMLLNKNLNSAVRYKLEAGLGALS